MLVRQSEEAALLVLDSPSVTKLYDPGARRLAPQIVFSSACPVVVMPPVDPAADADLSAFRLGRPEGEQQPTTAATT